MSPASPRKARTHDRILEVASRAIRRAGYDGVGVAAIMKEAGLTHGGFYAHCPSREALMAEAMQRAGRDTGGLLVARLRQALAEGASPFAALVQTCLADAQLENAKTALWRGARQIWAGAPTQRVERGLSAHPGVCRQVRP